MTVGIRKVTISLPIHLLDFADRYATQRKTNRSQIISQALAVAQAQEEERLAVEGYRFYAAEAIDFAQATDQITSEAFALSAGEVANGEAW